MVRLALVILFGALLGAATGNAQAQNLDVTPLPAAPWSEPGSVSHQQNERAKGLYASGQYAQAKAIWDNLASFGNLEALNNLGVYHQEGKAVPADYDTAIRYWKQAAERNFTPALMNLATVHRTGYPGHPPDLRAAFGYYVRAGRTGDGSGAFTAANMAFQGVGTVASFADGHRLLTLAADLGDPSAFMMMGKYDELGLNPRGDLLSAQDWYEKARQMGHPMAAAALAALPKPDVGAVYSMMRAERHADARRLAAELCRSNLDGQACSIQGQYDLTGASGVSRDYVAAGRALEFACAMKVSGSCLNFAHAVAEGSQVRLGSFSMADYMKAEQEYARSCDEDKNYTSCAGVIFFNYYSAFGLNNRQKIMAYGARACMNGGNDFACDVWMPMFNANVRATYGGTAGSASRQNGFGRFLGNTLGTIVQGLAAGAQAYSAGSGSSSSGYSGSTYAGGSSPSSSSTRDFNQYLNSVRSIGTAYSAPCPASNPYCR